MAECLTPGATQYACVMHIIGRLLKPHASEIDEEYRPDQLVGAMWYVADPWLKNAVGFFETTSPLKALYAAQLRLLSCREDPTIEAENRNHAAFILHDDMAQDILDVIERRPELPDGVVRVALQISWPSSCQRR